MKPCLRAAVLVLLAGVCQADETVTVSWTPPTTTQDGTPLKGRYEITRYEVIVNGESTTVPRSVTSHRIDVASGRTVEVVIKACHARLCSPPSNTLTYTAAGEAAGPASPPPASQRGDGGTPPREETHSLVWSGTGQGRGTVNYGRILDWYDGVNTEIRVDLSRARKGKVIEMGRFRLEIAGGKLRAVWRGGGRKGGDFQLVNQVVIDSASKHEALFLCRVDSGVWLLLVDGVPAVASQPGRCLGTASGDLRVGGAQGRAKIRIIDR